MTNSHNISKEEKTRFELSKEWLNKKNRLRFAHSDNLFAVRQRQKRKKNDF